MVLIRDSVGGPYSDVQLVHPYDTDPSRIPSTWTVLTDLPVGTPLTITSVKWIKTNNAGGWILAVGNIGPIGGTLAGTKFIYEWGDENINRAPWEDRSVPELRDVAKHGRHYQE